MINRSLLRIKAVQILYAYFQNENMTPKAAEKELDKSIAQTNDLYLLMLALPVELTHYAELYLDNQRNKYLPTDAERNPNMRFADNILAKQLAESEKIATFLSESKYTWNTDDAVLPAFYRAVTHTEHYADYMAQDVRSYEADKEIWRKIYKNDVPASAEIDAFLEEQSLYWNDDLDMVLSFAQKTIKHFTVDSVADDEIMTMADAEEDKEYLEFVHTLFRTVIAQSDKYEALIDAAVKNWEVERIAFMDTLIMKTALAELLTFPTIPASVTLNEYIEMAKAYSTPRSAPFINGILDKIVSNLKASGELVKPDIKL